MTFTLKCYQNNFMINNLNIASFGDCFGSVMACMAFALLLELSRGIDLYLRHYSVTGKNQTSSSTANVLSERTIRKRRFVLHLLRTLVHVAQTALSFILMLMVMNNFAGFLFSAVIALGIGYYLMNGVHPYTRSVDDVHLSNAHSDLSVRTDVVDDDENSSHLPVTTDSQDRNLSVNT